MIVSYNLIVEDKEHQLTLWFNQGVEPESILENASLIKISNDKHHLFLPRICTSNHSEVTQSIIALIVQFYGQSDLKKNAK